MKATEHYFPVVLFSMLYKEVPQANQTYCVIPGVIYGLKAADVGGIFNRFHQNKIAVIFVCFSWLFLVVLCTKQPNFGAFACKNCTEKIESQCSCPYELLLKPNYKDHRRSELLMKLDRLRKKTFLPSLHCPLVCSGWFTRNFFSILFLTRAENEIDKMTFKPARTHQGTME